MSSRQHHHQCPFWVNRGDCNCHMGAGPSSAFTYETQGMRAIPGLGPDVISQQGIGLAKVMLLAPATDGPHDCPSCTFGEELDETLAELARARELLREVLAANPCKYLNGIHASDCTVEAIRAFLDGGSEPDASQSNWAAFNGIGRTKP